MEDSKFVKPKSRFPDVKAEYDKVLQFVQEKRGDQVRRIVDGESKVFTLALDDVLEYLSDLELVTDIMKNATFYKDLVARAVDAEVQKLEKEDEKNGIQRKSEAEMDIKELQNSMRKRRLEMIKKEKEDVQAGFPAELFRDFEVRLLPLSSAKPIKLREVRAEHIGSLIQMSGIVTKVTDVQPLMRVAAYVCDECGCESYQTVKGREYTPLKKCPSEICEKNKSEGKLFPQTRASRFQKFQEIRLQEESSEVPVGHIPRTMTILAIGEQCRACRPGESVSVIGIYLPIPITGFRGFHAGLTTEVYLDLMDLQVKKQNYDKMTISDEIQKEIDQKSEEKDIYNMLSSSISPEIYGLADVKKALLIALVGGETRHLPDIKIRGDINVLLMGDPGVAKSQLLKYIVRLAPRGVYTTGKGSSGVGLTAAVLRDNLTGELSLEGGALVLADKGVCCIDEFDKMEESDRTTIHEVMEQQSVSVAKAGIITTLNARAAIIAAANPVLGRWNKAYSAEHNLGLPQTLISRFDLTFVILDQPDEDNDRNLGAHITHVHQKSCAPPLSLEFEPFSQEFLRAYIAKARSFSPSVPHSLVDYIVSSYVAMRQESNVTSSARDHTDARQRFCSPRMLVSLLRLCMALARIHFRSQITRSDVEEAIRLLYESKRSSASEKEDKKRSEDDISAAFQIVKDYAQTHEVNEIKTRELQRSLALKSITPEVFHRMVEQYTALGVLTWKTASKDAIKITDTELAPAKPRKRSNV
eukprot:TRINITY_DN2489_c0_g1_i1.p1 TRINITY_DN2489_c0_g1~~TRINITY_DN2489_c0_g1_i1.p1  ORF type:complete len:755 (+),score=209.31 TRINITY_DN2489_c0_g1_i1:102-2366(+)